MGVCYLALCDRSYPKSLAFQYLDEVQKEFNQNYGVEVGSVARPYAFVKFGKYIIDDLNALKMQDSFLQKIKKQYRDTKTQRNLNKLNDDLQDVQRIMTKNIQDVLGRGEHLDQMSHFSANLSEESKKYLKETKRMNLQALYQKYGPPIAVVSLISLLLYLRFFWW